MKPPISCRYTACIGMTIKYVCMIGIIITTLMMSGVASFSMVQPTVAGDTSCDIEPNDPRCTGEKGVGGMTFCDLAWSDPADVDRFGDCYDRDFSTIDCDEHPGHSRCGTTGRDGLIFCDKQYEDIGFKENCYDRNDNPTEYCDKYAIDESDYTYTARFCQSICENYEDVTGRGEPCE